MLQTSSLHPPRVLVVEDHGPCAQLTKIALSSAGYEVTVARSIEEAFLALAEQEFDGLVSDLLFPEGSGCDVIRLIRAEGSKMLAVAISGLPRDVCEAEAMEAGFDHFVQKPFRPGALLALVKAGLPPTR